MHPLLVDVDDVLLSGLSRRACKAQAPVERPRQVDVSFILQNGAVVSYGVEAKVLLYFLNGDYLAA